MYARVYIFLFLFWCKTVVVSIKISDGSLYYIPGTCMYVSVQTALAFPSLLLLLLF